MPQLSAEKIEVITAILVGDQLEQAYWAGNAAFSRKDNYFKVKLSLFESPWYLSPNQNGPDTYTIFRKIHKEGKKITFTAPIGKASFSGRFKDLLELNVPLWNPKYPAFGNLRRSVL